jgi:hypothetical protein
MFTDSQDFRHTDTSLAAPVHTAPQLTASTVLDDYALTEDGDGEVGEGEDGEVGASRRRLTQDMIVKESCEDIDEVGFVVKEWGTGLSALQTKLNVQLFEILCCSRVAPKPERLLHNYNLQKSLGNILISYVFFAAKGVDQGGVLVGGGSL